MPEGIHRGGSIATAATVQTLAPINIYRKGIRFQNTSDTDMWLSVSSAPAAVGVGFKITPGVILDLPVSGTATLFCAAAGKIFAAVEL